MFLRKKTLLTMIEVLNGEVANLKNKVSELEAFNNTKKINFNIDGKEVYKNFLDSTESIVKINSDGLIVKGKMNINGYKGQV
jgi:hypothetical protein